MTDQNVNETAAIDRDVQDAAARDADHDSSGEHDAVPATSGEAPQYGVGPFSIREVILGGVWLVAFIVSFFSVASQQAMAQLLFGGSVWTNGLDWILTIGVPTVAVFLIVLRRFSPDGIRRVGSLGIDQFASVAFSVSAVVWLTLLWRNVAVAIESGIWIYGWVVWLQFFLMLAGVVLTVFAPVIPGLKEDFEGRREVAAHRSARPIRAVAKRPAREPRPAPEHSAGAHDETAAYGAGAYGGELYADDSAYARHDAPEAAYAYAPDEEASSSDHRAAADQGSQDAWAAPQTEIVEQEPVAETRHQAFWALVPEERDIVDERDVPIFRIGPSAWALVLEDRGEVFVVRHEDGRVGYLHDVSGVTRG